MSDHPIPYAEPLSEDVLARLREKLDATDARSVLIDRLALRLILARLDYLEDAYRWFSESGQARKDVWRDKPAIQVDDDQYRKAVGVVVRDQKPSTSYVQRKLQIGYNTASAIMARMEASGIVSAPDFNSKRSILPPYAIPQEPTADET